MGLVLLKTERELAICQQGGKILARIFYEVIPLVKAGQTTLKIEQIIVKLLKKYHTQSAFLGYRGFPNNSCISVNEEVVHGIPSNRILKTGDLIGLDLGIKYQGFCTDMAVTIPLRPISAAANHLLVVTKKALQEAIRIIKPGVRLGDVGWRINNIVQSAGFKAVRDLSGHGIGQQLQEEPAVPNFGQRGEGVILQPGMVLAVEPMVCLGSGRTQVLPDGWTVVTTDRSLAAHFEHTVAVTENGGRVLTKI